MQTVHIVKDWHSYNYVKISNIQQLMRIEASQCRVTVQKLFDYSVIIFPSDICSFTNLNSCACHYDFLKLPMFIPI